MNNKVKNFKKDVAIELDQQSKNMILKKLSSNWINESLKAKYSYHFESLGIPIIQYPQDMIAMQELIWEIKPDLIIETGIAHGGSLIMNASMLTMLDVCEAIELNKNINPKKSKRKVLGIDIDIRSHNRREIEKHPMYSRIEMIEGSSIDPQIIEIVKKESKNYKRILVSLDSNHTHDHLIKELQAYAPLTSKDSYCVVFDTIIEDMPSELSKDRFWGPGNNPKTAIKQFLNENDDFIIDKDIQNKLLITVAPDGYLKRVK